MTVTCICGNDTLSACSDFIGDGHWVECMKCGRNGPRKPTQDEAIKAWKFRLEAEREETNEQARTI